MCDEESTINFRTHVSSRNILRSNIEISLLFSSPPPQFVLIRGEEENEGEGNVDGHFLKKERILKS